MRKNLILLLGLICLIGTSYSRIGRASVISIENGASSYDEIVDDMYNITSGDAVDETLFEFANLNTTAYYLNEVGYVTFLHTVNGNFSEFMEGESGYKVEILYFYFPEVASFESDALNCTIVIHELDNGQANSETFVWFLNYTAYISMDWLNATHPISMENLVLNQAINGSGSSIATSLDDVYWEDPEQIFGMSLISALEGGGGIIDVFPEFDELGSGRNPIYDLGTVSPTWANIFTLFYGSGTTDTTTTTTSSQQGGGGAGKPWTSSTSTPAILPFAAFDVPLAVLIFLLFVILSGSFMYSQTMMKKRVGRRRRPGVN